MKELILIRGLPGTGKSKFAQDFYPQYMNLDIEDFFSRDGQYRFDASKIKDAHMWCLSLTKFYLNQGESVTVATHFCKEWEIMGYISAGIKYNAKIKIIVCDTVYGNPHKVPNHIQEQMKNSWENFTLEDCFRTLHDRQVITAEKKERKMAQLHNQNL